MTNLNKQRNKKMILAAMFLALGMALPFLTSQVKEIGDSLLPMHLAVMLCGIICGSRYGLVVGLLLPVLRGFCFGMPRLYPNAMWMSPELAVYGFSVGFFYSVLPKNRKTSVYISLLGAMLCGRIIWGILKAVILGVSEKQFTIAMFVAEGFVDAIPGIILQLLLIPLIVSLVKKENANGQN